MEGFGGGGVVASAFGERAGSRRPLMAAIMAARMVARLAGPLPVRLVAVSSWNVTSRTDMVVHLDGPVLADQPGQIRRNGIGAGQAGDGVGGLAGDLAGGGVLAPAGDLDGLAPMREVQAANVGGLQGADLDAAVPGLAGRTGGRYLPPGQCLDLACIAWLFFTTAM